VAAAAAAGFDDVDQLDMVDVAVQLAVGAPRGAPKYRGARLKVSGLLFGMTIGHVIQVTADGVAAMDDAGRPPSPSVVGAVGKSWVKAM
jgi:carbonic anhydrase